MSLEAASLQIAIRLLIHECKSAVLVMYVLGYLKGAFKETNSIFTLTSYETPKYQITLFYVLKLVNILIFNAQKLQSL